MYELKYFVKAFKSANSGYILKRMSLLSDGFRSRARHELVDLADFSREKSYAEFSVSRTCKRIRLVFSKKKFGES